MKNLVHFALGLASVLMPAVSAADPPPTAVLTMRVTQFRSNDGQVSCALYASEAGFPTDPSKAAQVHLCKIQAKTSSCSFEPIPAGTYGVACFHDENGNGKLDTGLFGIPKEGTVASNHAQGSMGPPPFDKAKFSFAGQATTLELRMSY